MEKIYKKALGLFFSAAAAMLLVCSCGTKQSTVAVVVDEVTYGKIGEAVDKYVEAISLPDRKGVLVLDKWQQPDSIRAELKKMYENNCLEGAVFVGNIPVPMIRDAQHLTSAFKRDQKMNWILSSVPSDRFYDDFDLKFDYIRQDSVATINHYYSLRADSPQEINCDIYSARIKAPIDGNEHKAIEAFLLKAVEAHKNPERMEKVMHFGGHGCDSESIQARIDEAVSMHEQFPFTTGSNGKLLYIDFSRDYYIKERLISAMEDDLDFAILHHHGLPDTQFFSGTPLSNNIATWIELSRNYLRSKMNSSKNRKNPEAAIANFIKQYGVPRSWMTDYNDPEKLMADSLHSANMNLTLEEIDSTFVTNTKFVMLNACFNGAYTYDDYIASRYIFNPGATIAVKANSVNTLQDIWALELSGLLNLGVSVGDTYKGQFTLEQHLFGDPTFTFAPQTEVLGGYNIARDIVFKKSDAGYWRRILEDKSKDLAPEMRALAIKMLYNNNAITSDQLVEILKESPYQNVRLEALSTLRQIADENLFEGVKIALNDSYEFTRRIAANVAGKSGNPEFIPYLAELLVNPLTTRREYFQADMTTRSFDAETFIAEVDKIRGDYASWYTDEKFERLTSKLRRSEKYNTIDYNNLSDDKVSAKEKMLTLNGERNNCSVFALDGMYHIIANGAEPEQVLAAEVLGWYVYSYKKAEIIAKAKELYEKAPEGAVKSELLKTINRLENKRK